MHASMIGSIGSLNLAVMQAHAATATPGDGGRVSFRESLQAARAVEKPAVGKPADPVSAAKVGTSPLAKMRTPDASSADDVAATHAVTVGSKAGQDTGAVVVAKDARDSKNTDKAETQAAVETGVVTKTSDQPLAVPLPAVASNGKSTPKAGGHENSKSDIAESAAIAATDDPQGTQAAVVFQTTEQLPALPLPVLPVVDAPAVSSKTPAATKGLSNLASSGPAKGSARESSRSDIAVRDAGTATKIESDATSLPVAPAAALPGVHETANGPNTLVSDVALTPGLHAIASPGSKSSVAAGDSAVPAPAVHAASSQAEVATLVATPNVLEVGVAAGSHGWLRVRAELGQMGQVTASVAAASSGAAEGLHKELPAIAAYLASERVDVSALTVSAGSVSAMGKTAGAQDAAMSFGSGTNQRGDSQADVPEKTAEKMTGGSSEAVFESGWQSFQLPAAMLSNGSGSWLSVRV